MKPHEILGPIGRQLCWMFNGVVVGGAAKARWQQVGPLKEGGFRGIPVIKDVDIVIPVDEWVKACKLIPEKAVANRFGGFKFDDPNVGSKIARSVDVWPDDVLRMSIAGGNKYIWVPRTDTMLIDAEVL